METPQPEGNQLRGCPEMGTRAAAGPLPNPSDLPKCPVCGDFGSLGPPVGSTSG